MPPDGPGPDGAGCSSVNQASAAPATTTTPTPDSTYARFTRVRVYLRSVTRTARFRRTVSDLAQRLLTADDAERDTLARSADLATIESLGHTRESAAAEVLLRIEQSVGDRALRKAARRELHRLRSVGIEPPAGGVAGAASPEPVADAKPKTLAVSQAWGTDTDPTG